MAKCKQGIQEPLVFTHLLLWNLSHESDFLEQSKKLHGGWQKANDKSHNGEYETLWGKTTAQETFLKKTFQKANYYHNVATVNSVLPGVTWMELTRINASISLHKAEMLINHLKAVGNRRMWATKGMNFSRHLINVGLDN